MSGDKNFTNDSVEEILHKAVQKQSLQSDIRQIRQNHDIPEDGFADRVGAEKWWLNKPQSFNKQFEEELDFDSELETLMIKYNLPLGTFLLLESYAMTNRFDFLVKLPHDFYNCEFEEVLDSNRISPMEIKWKRSKKPFIRLYISENISLPMIKKYLDRHWKYIKKNIFEKKAGSKVVRRGQFLERNKLIWYYYKKSRSELGLRRGEYKDIKVSSILRNKHGIEVGPENIRKIIQRIKELRDS